MNRRKLFAFKIASLAICLTLCAALLPSCQKKYVELDDVPLSNFVKAEVGEEIAVLHIEHNGESLGMLRLKLFPELVPEGVENFKSLVSNGYYNGCVFFFVDGSSYTVSGDPSGTGSGGKAWNDKKIFCSPSNELCNFIGAVGFTTQTEYIDSKFYIISGGTVTEDDFMAFAFQDNQKYFASNVKAKYIEAGGQPGFDNTQNMVFGQLFEEDFPVLRAITSVEVNASKKPVKAVKITKAEIVAYDGK